MKKSQKQLYVIFRDGQQIRHKGCRCRNEWIGVYNKEESVIICNGKKYTSISGFSWDHYLKDRPDRKPNNNGWDECQWKVNGKWEFFDDETHRRRKSV